MNFYPHEPFDNNQAQRAVWHKLKQAFQKEPSVAYFRYPVFSQNGRRFREPDFPVLHRRLGLWGILCEGFSIGNIAAIEEDHWLMQDWREEVELPLLDAEEPMYAVKPCFASWLYTQRISKILLFPFFSEYTRYP